jgi:hypothetical protein
VNTIQVTVTFGAIDLSNIHPKSAPSKVVVNAKQWKIHENYNNITHVHDIALVHLPFHITPNANVSLGVLYFFDPSNAASFNANYANKLATVAGWGRTAGDATTLPSLLQYASNLKVVSVTECQYHWPYVTNNQICVKASNTSNLQVIVLKIHNGIVFLVVSYLEAKQNVKFFHNDCKSLPDLRIRCFVFFKKKSLRVGSKTL